MLLLVSFSAINALLITTVTQLEVLRGDYCSCKMLLCWLKSSNASLKLSSICSECSTRRLKPGRAAVKSGQHWDCPFPGRDRAWSHCRELPCSGGHGPWTGALVSAGNILGSVCEALQRARQSSGCARQQGQLEQPRSFISPCWELLRHLPEGDVVPEPIHPHQGQGGHTPESEQEGATGLLLLEICSSGMSKASSH